MMLFSGRTKEKEKIKQNKRKNSLMARNFLFSPKNRNATGRKASSSAFLQGSLTVESAFVLPLFFLVVCTLISFMDIYRLQTMKLTQLCEKAKETAMYAYSLGTESDIILPSVYTYRPVIAVIPLPNIVMNNQVRIHPWTGCSSQEEGGEKEEMVYVALTGGVYHRSGNCTHLKLSVKQTEGNKVTLLRNDYGGKYQPCERCVSQGAAGIVYVTNTGDRYHNQSTCSGLKRTVRLVKISQVAHMGACSRCGGGH